MERWAGPAGGDPGLWVCQVGEEVCGPLHSYGPAVRDHVLLHFVASGEGTFYARGGAHRVGAGKGFAIFPDQITTYRASKDDPWHYLWVGFAGYGAEAAARRAGLSREEPVFAFDDAERAMGVARGMRRDAASLRLGAMAALGGLYQLLALIGERGAPEALGAAQGYCDKALWYMRGNYGRRTTVEEVADYVGLSRSQLFRVFQRGVGRSPKACLTQIRVRRALELLEAGHLTVEQVAASCGISGAARLNALLRDAVGMSAARCRKERPTLG